MIDTEKSIAHYSQETSLQSVQPLASRSLFWKARYLRNSKTLPNIPALFWLTEVVRPSVFLAPEIGDGVAYFAVCQSVERNGFETRCFASAIAEIGEDQRRYNEENYSDFSFILRRKDWEGRSRISGVDLLYVSQALLSENQYGFFHALKPRLSDRCVVIFEGLDLVEEQVRQNCIEALALGSGARVGFEQGPGLTVYFRETLQNDRLQQLAKLTLGGHGYGSVQTIFTRLGQAHAAEHGMHVLEQSRGAAEAALAAHAERTEKQQSEIAELQRKLEETARAYDARSNQIAMFQAKIFDLTSKLDAGETKKSEELAGLLADAERRTAELRDAWTASEGAVLSHRATLDELSAKLTSREEEIAALQARAEHLAGEVGRREAVERDLTAALQARDETVKEANQERDAALNEERMRATADIAARDETIRRTEDALNAARVAGEAKDAKLAALKEESEQRKAIEGELRAQIAQMDEELARLRGLAGQVEAERASERETLQAETGRLEAELAQLRLDRLEEERRHVSERQGLAGELTVHQSGIAALRAEIEDLKQSRAAAEAEAAQLGRELAKHKVVEADLRAELHHAQSDLTVRYDELARMTELCEQREAELAAAGASLSQLQADHDSLVRSHDEATRALDAARKDSGAEVRRLQRELKARTAAESALQADLETAEAALSKLRSDHDQMAKEHGEAVRALEAAAKQSEAEVRRLQRELDARSAAERTLSAELDEARSNLSRRFEEIARITLIADEREAARKALDSELSKLRAVSEKLHNEKQIQSEIRASALKMGKTSLNRGLIGRFLTKENREALEAIRASEFFDSKWYLDTYPDIAESGLDAAQHYLFYGASEGRNPGPRFDTMDYYAANRDVSRSGENALVHYELRGRAKSRPLTEKQRRKA